MAGQKPKFDPSKPFEAVAEAKPKFDPTKPFEAAPPNVAQAASAATSTPRGGLDALTTPRDFLNFATSIGENIPVLGPATVGAGEHFGALLLSKTKGIPFDDALQLIQQENEHKRADKVEESPIAAGVAAPMAAAAMVPMPGANMEGAAGVATRVLGNASVSAADDIARGDQDSAVKDAGITGLVQGAIETSPLLRGLADRRAVKAALGQNKRAFKEADKVKVLDRLGSDLLSPDEAGKPVIGLASSVDNIADKAGAKRKFFGEKIGEVVDLVDAAKPGAVSGTNIAERFLNQAASIPENENTRPIIAKLLKDAETYADRGQMTLREAQDLKNTYKVDLKTDPSDIADLYKNFGNRAIRQEMEDTVSSVANEIPGLDKLGAEYARFKGKYQTMKTAEKAAADRVSADKANRFLSPTDYLIGATVGGSNMVASYIGGGQNAQDSILYGALGAAAHHVIRTRGASFAAKNARFLSDILEANPSLFGKYKGELEAASAQGSKALMATHEALLASPDYRAITDAIAGQFAKADGDTAAITDPMMIASHKDQIESNDSLSSIEKAKRLTAINKKGYYTVDMRPYNYDDDRPTPHPADAPTSDDARARLLDALKRNQGH